MLYKYIHKAYMIQGLSSVEMKNKHGFLNHESDMITRALFIVLVGNIMFF